MEFSRLARKIEQVLKIVEQGVGDVNGSHLPLNHEHVFTGENRLQFFEGASGLAHLQQAFLGRPIGIAEIDTH